MIRRLLGWYFLLLQALVIKKPTAPVLSENPIEKAREKYERAMLPIPSWTHNSAAQIVSLHPSIAPRLDLLRMSHNVEPIGRSFSVECQTVYASCRQILHKDAEEFYGFYLVPAVRGKGRIKVRMMCSEYLEPEEYEMDIKVV